MTQLTWYRSTLNSVNLKAIAIKASVGDISAYLPATTDTSRNMTTVVNTLSSIAGDIKVIRGTIPNTNSKISTVMMSYLIFLKNKKKALLRIRAS